jgi:hypothetical protein
VNKKSGICMNLLSNTALVASFLVQKEARPLPP